MNKRLHAYYSGSVQGVGFRFTAERLALSLGLNGWIKNLPDGRVEVVLEGDEADIGEFLRKIAGVFRDYIADIDSIWDKYKGEFTLFDIRFD